MAATKLSVAHYSPLLDKISGLVAKWTSSSLSYAGRMELIRSVVQGVNCYWLSIFNIPAAVVYSIQRICSIFLWGAKVARIKWEDLCFPKNEGGLGFKNLKIWNLSMLCCLKSFGICILERKLSGYNGFIVFSCVENPFGNGGDSLRQCVG